MTAIPEGLRARPQWVVWRAERRDAKVTKVPYCVATGQRASSTDPSTWTTYERAAAFARQPGVDGVGYVFAPDDPFVGIDLDDCGDGEELHPAARAIVDQLQTYSERSVSGNGVHAIGVGQLNGFPRNRRAGMPWGGGIELYDEGRFFVVTGDRLPGSPGEPAGCQAALEALLAELFPAPSPNGQPVPTAPSGRTDAEVLERAFAAKNGTEIQALYRGVVDGYPSRSEADLALAGRLAFWTGPDPEQLDRLMRGSGLMRDKWDTARGESTYGRQTVEKAISERRDFYGWHPLCNKGETKLAVQAPAEHSSEPSGVRPGRALAAPRAEELSRWDDRKLDREIGRGVAAAGSYLRSYEAAAAVTGLLLMERRRRCGPRGFAPWLRDHFDGHRDTAYRYIRMAEEAGLSVGSIRQIEPPPAGLSVQPAARIEPEEAAFFEVLEAKVKKDLPPAGQRGALQVWKLQLVDGQGEVHEVERTKKPHRAGKPPFARGRKVFGHIKQGPYSKNLVEEAEPNRRRLGKLLGGLARRLSGIALEEALALCDDAELNRWIESSTNDERAARELRERLERERLERRRAMGATGP